MRYKTVALPSAADSLISAIDLWPLWSWWLDINNVLMIYTVLSCVKNAVVLQLF